MFKVNNMLVLAILFTVHAGERLSDLTELGSCVSGSSFKVSQFAITNFPPNGNTLLGTFQSTVVGPVVPNLAVISLSGNDGSHSTSDVTLVFNPTRTLALDFDFDVSISNGKSVSYVLQVNIENSQQSLGCFQKTFAIWRSI